jgi:hypothetical protein
MASYFRRGTLTTDYQISLLAGTWVISRTHFSWDFFIRSALCFEINPAYVLIILNYQISFSLGWFTSLSTILFPVWQLSLSQFSPQSSITYNWPIGLYFAILHETSQRCIGTGTSDLCSCFLVMQILIESFTLLKYCLSLPLCQTLQDPHGSALLLVK